MRGSMNRRACVILSYRIQLLFQGTSYMTSTMGGNVRQATPELLLVEDGTVPMVSTNSDMYSYGNVALQVLIPYYPQHNGKLYHRLDLFRSEPFLGPP